MDSDPSKPPTSDAAAQRELIHSLLASDLAAEVKAEFDGRLTIGCDVPAASKYVFVRFHNALTSPHDGPVVLLALAALQLREQHLLAFIRDAALELIESGEAMAAYRADDSQLRKERREMLEQFVVALQAAPVQE
jgi:hypothetical protein